MKIFKTILCLLFISTNIFCMEEETNISDFTKALNRLHIAKKNKKLTKVLDQLTEEKFIDLLENSYDAKMGEKVQSGLKCLYIIKPNSDDSSLARFLESAFVDLRQKNLRNLTFQDTHGKALPPAVVGKIKECLKKNYSFRCLDYGDGTYRKINICCIDANEVLGEGLNSDVRSIDFGGEKVYFKMKKPLFPEVKRICKGCVTDVFIFFVVATVYCIVVVILMDFEGVELWIKASEKMTG